MASIVTLKRGQKPRIQVTVAPPPGGANPWLLADEFGAYGAVTVKQGAVHYLAAYRGGPPFWSEAVPVQHDAANPRMVLDSARRLWLVYEDTAGHNASLTYSADDGATWEEPVVAIAGGAKPTIAAGFAGDVIICAVVAGKIIGRVQEPGEAALGTPFTFQAWNGTSLADMLVQDDTFHLQQERGPHGRWWLHALLQGETETSHWWSSDLASWTRAT